MSDNINTAEHFCGGETWRIIYIEDDGHHLFGERKRHGSFRLCRNSALSRTRSDDPPADVAVILRPGEYLKNNCGWPAKIELKQAESGDPLTGEIPVTIPDENDPEKSVNTILKMKLHIPTKRNTVQIDYGDAVDKAGAASHGGRAHGEN